MFGTKKSRRTVEVVPEKKSKKSGSSSKKSGTDGGNALLQGLSASATTTLVGLGMTIPSEDNKSVKIEPITFAKYAPGALVMGYVLQVTEARLLVSLPGGLTGIVPYQEVSDTLYRLEAASEQQQQQGKSKGKGKEDRDDAKALSQLKNLVSPMQAVQCYVLEVNNPRAPSGAQQNPLSDMNMKSKTKKGIVLSMRPSLVNRGLAFKHLVTGFPIYGCVASAEDHGYVINGGVGGVNFFLPFKAHSLGDKLPIGSPVNCIIDSINETARTVTLRAKGKAIADAVVANAQLPFNAIRAGMMFNIVIDKIVSNGVLVKFFSSFNGVIDIFSLSRPFAEGSWSKSVSVGDAMQARVIFVDHGTKSLRFSVRPHILAMQVPANLPPSVKRLMVSL